MNISDLDREYIPDVILRGNGMLIRDVNFGGAPMSIIYDDEPRMIRDWNERHD